MSDKSDKKELVGDEMELEKSDDGRMTEGEFTSEPADSNNHKTICGYKLQGMTLVILAVLGVSLAITIAFILDIIFGTRPTKFHGAVSSDSTICSDKGLQILKSGGNAIDSAVVTALCLSLVRPDVVSLGGCGQTIILQHSNLSSFVIDGQCSVPSALQSSPPASIAAKGGESIGVPGFLPMLFSAHQSSGRFDWAYLVNTIRNMSSDEIKVSSQMRMSGEVYSDSNINKLPKEVADNFKKSYFTPNSKLNALFKKISEAKSIKDITSGILADEIVEAARAKESKITADDINSYNVTSSKAITAHFSELSIITSADSSWGGPMLASTLNILNSYRKSGLRDESSFYRTMVEVFKHVQLKSATLGNMEASRSVVDSMLTDKFVEEVRSKVKSGGIFNSTGTDFVPFSTIENHGGASLAVIDPDNLAVAMTLSLGSPYGSGVISSSGIILNNALSLFADKENNKKTQNVIQSKGQKPLTGLAPVILFNPQRKCGPRVMMAANHGDRAGTGLVQWIISALLFDKSICIDSDCLSLGPPSERPRLHAMLGGIKLSQDKTVDILVEQNFPSSVTIYLKNLGYKLDTVDEAKDVLQIINAVGKTQNIPSAITDPRNKGQSAVTF